MSIMQTYTCDESLSTKCKQMCENFTTLNSLYRDVYSSVAHCLPMSEQVANHCQEKINKYMQHYRSMSPNILQQHHILEDHAGEWILSHKFGLGLHGEQGGEGGNTQRIQKTRANDELTAE